MLTREKGERVLAREKTERESVCVLVREKREGERVLARENRG